MNDSPFTLQRFEHELSHLYYLPEKPFTTIQGAKSSYLIGSRGTGKTTLMHSLIWSERLKNDSLIRALNDDPFGSKIIGVYLGVPSFSLKSIDAWLSKYDEDVRCIIVSLYFELIALELLSVALSNLIVEGVVEAKPKDEHVFSAEMLGYSEKINNYIKSANDVPSLQTLADTFLRMRRALEGHALKRSAVDVVVDLFPLDQVGAFIDHFSNKINVLYPKLSQDAVWRFKVCFDETETLTKFNQKVINTLVRISSGVVSFVVSYVRKVDDFTSTFLPNLTLGSADRSIVYLEDMDDLGFKDLAEGVATVRVQKYTGSCDLSFNVERVYGNIDINYLLNRILGVSESGFAKDLIKKAKALLKTEYYKDTVGRRIKDRREILPIYEAYLFDKLNLAIPKPGESRWKRRSQSSREIRKKMVAAYLCICKELKGTTPKYAYSNMLLGMSCACIRDYLLFVDETFIESQKDVSSFVSEMLSIDKQDKALKRASGKKFDSIPSSSGISAPVRVSRLIDGLSEITEYIQTQGPNNIALRSSERGRFQIENQPDYLEGDLIVRRLIKDAAEAGFLKTFITENKTLQFQVHHSLAAKYHFSYRGAYYTTMINSVDIASFVLPESESARRSALNTVKKKLARDEDSKQISLFEYVEG